MKKMKCLLGIAILLLVVSGCSGSSSGNANHSEAEEESAESQETNDIPEAPSDPEIMVEQGEGLFAEANSLESHFSDTIQPEYEDLSVQEAYAATVYYFSQIYDENVKSYDNYQVEYIDFPKMVEKLEEMRAEKDSEVFKDIQTNTWAANSGIELNEGLLDKYRELADIKSSFLDAINEEYSRFMDVGDLLNDNDMITYDERDELADYFEERREQLKSFNQKLFISTKEALNYEKRRVSTLITDTRDEYLGVEKNNKNEESDTEGQIDQEPDEREKSVLVDIKLPFLKEEKGWEVGYSNLAENNIMFEFVHNGETVQNWTELATVSFYSYQSTVFPSADAYAKEVMENVEKTVKNGDGDINVNFMQESEEETILEFMVTDTKGYDDQHELQRVFLGENGIWYLHYVTKGDVPMDDNRKEKWLEYLKNVEVESGVGGLEI